MAFTTLELAFLVLAVEFAVIAMVILFLSMKGRRGEEAAVAADAKQLERSVDRTEESRHDALATILRENYHFNDSEIDNTVKEFADRERAFYNTLVGIYLGRSEKKLKDVPDELAKVVAPWVSVTPKNTIDPAQVEALTSENANLTDENSVLHQELTSTKQVMEELMAEYNAAFFKLGPQTPDAATHDETAADATAEDDSDADGEAAVADVQNSAIDENAAPQTAIFPVDDNDPDMDAEDETDSSADDDAVVEFDISDDEDGEEDVPPAMTAEDIDALMDSIGSAESEETVD